MKCQDLRNYVSCSSESFQNNYENSTRTFQVKTNRAKDMEFDTQGRSSVEINNRRSPGHGNKAFHSSTDCSEQVETSSFSSTACAQLSDDTLPSFSSDLKTECQVSEDNRMVSDFPESNSEHANDSSDPAPESTKQPSNNDLSPELSENPTAESSEDSFSLDTTRRTRRSSKRKREIDEYCPVCGVTIRVPELQNHFAKEIENLGKISKNIRKPKREEAKAVSECFIQVKSNRENRLTAKLAKYAARAKNEVQCPVCSLRMIGSHEEVNKHVVNCISQDENSDELIVDDDDDDDESFEEYEFADQTRIRPISLVPGGYRSLEGNSARCRVTTDEDLNVDVDDTLTYGEPQYTELDVIPSTMANGEAKELEQLRKAVLVDPTVQPHVLESRKWTSHEGTIDEDLEIINSVNERLSGLSKSTGDEVGEDDVNFQSNHVVSSLKEKIKDLEEQNKSVKCLICMEPYTKPVVSTTCWHVHCEECWLMTMGVKKLCPQCNVIVFPSDLRRIYL